MGLAWGESEIIYYRPTIGHHGRVRERARTTPGRGGGTQEGMVTDDDVFEEGGVGSLSADR